MKTEKKDKIFHLNNGKGMDFTGELAKKGALTSFT